MLNNIGLPGLILIGLVLWLVIWLVKPSKRKLDEAADQLSNVSAFGTDLTI